MGMDVTEKNTLNPSDDPREQLAALAPRVPGWLAHLTPPWGPVPFADVPDLAQDVMVTAFGSISRYDPAKGAMSVWLYVIAQRKARDHRKRAYTREKFAKNAEVSEVHGSTQDPEEAMISAQYRRLAEETTGEMPEDLRDVLGAVEFSELSHEEAAELLGISKRTVKDRLERAREDFTRRMKRKVRDHGLPVLPFMVDGMFAFIRARNEKLAEQYGPGLRAIVEQAPGSGARPVDGGVPDAGATGASTTAAGVGSFVGGNVTGAIGGGLLVYLLLRSTAAPAPPVTTSVVEEQVPVVAAAPVMVREPVSASVPTASSAADSVRRVADPMPEARAILERALGALERGDVATARVALDGYERRFPGNPLPKVKASAVEWIGRMEGEQGGP